MNDLDYVKSIIKVSKESDGKYDYEISCKMDDDPDLNFEEKLLFIKDGAISIKFWFGAFPIEVLNTALKVFMVAYEVAIPPPSELPSDDIIALFQEIHAQELLWKCLGNVLESKSW